MSVVADSTPLISLALIDSLHLLKSLYGTIYIPEAVYQEVVVIGKGKIGSDEVRQAVWIERRSVRKGRANKLIAAGNLGRGEGEAIVLCQELNADLFIVDDDHARKYAFRLKISLIGTAGILVLAKENGLITDVRQPLEQLMARGFYMSRASFQTILRVAGET